MSAFHSKFLHFLYSFSIHAIFVSRTLFGRLKSTTVATISGTEQVI